MENKLKLSAYLFKNLYHIKRHQLGLFFSGRTAKTFLYQLTPIILSSMKILGI